MKAGDRVEVLPVPPIDGRASSVLRGRGTLVATRSQRGEVGYLVRLDGDEAPIYFGPGRVIPISEESQQHVIAGE